VLFLTIAQRLLLWSLNTARTSQTNPFDMWQHSKTWNFYE
jgi:hypothetical protein